MIANSPDAVDLTRPHPSLGEDVPVNGVSTPMAKRHCPSPQVGAPCLDDLHKELAGASAGPLMQLLAPHNMNLLFATWLQCGANSVATERELCQNFPRLDESQTLEDAQVSSPVHGSASIVSEPVANRTPPVPSIATTPPDASSCAPVPGQLLVHPMPPSPMPPVAVPEDRLSVPTAMRSGVAHTPVVPMAAVVQEPIASTPAPVALQPVPAASAALELNTTSGQAQLQPVHPVPVQLKPVAAAILPSAHGFPTALWPAPTASAETSVTQAMDAVTLDYVHRQDAPLVRMSPVGFALAHPPPTVAQHDCHDGPVPQPSNLLTAAAMPAWAEPGYAPQNDIAPQQLFGHHPAHTAAVGFVTPTRGQPPSQPSQAWPSK